MFKSLILASLLLSSLAAQASSKCLISTRTEKGHNQKIVALNQEHMQIEESIRNLKATIVVMHGRLISMTILNTNNVTQAMAPMNSIAETGGGAVGLEDSKTQSAIELTCKMEY